MLILVANVGSTSFKSKLYDMETETMLARAGVERVGSDKAILRFQTEGKLPVDLSLSIPNQTEAIKLVLDFLVDPEVGCLSSLDQIDGVGFKAVHAGEFRGPALVTEEVISIMEKYNGAAPSHNPPYIGAMKNLRHNLPAAPQVAAFETAFHANIPDYAYIYSVPYDWYEKYGVRRYGFHGASLRYVSERAPHITGQTRPGLRLVACHLGGSSSICAILDGKSIDTSMGFTPQAGIPMSSRCGDIDAFILPYMREQTGMELTELAKELSSRGGLLGISGLSADVRDLELAAAQGNARAALALNSFAYAVKKYIGSYVAALNGVDVLTFSGGIGENAAEMRARICSGLEFLGIELDNEVNLDCRGTERRISSQTSLVQVWVVPTNEELIVARQTTQLIRDSSGPSHASQ